MIKSQRGYLDSWTVSGHLGLVSICKLSCFSYHLFPLLFLFKALFFIAVDRFTALVFALRASVRSTKKFFFILVTWFSAMVICSPLTFGVKLVGEVERT